MKKVLKFHLERETKGAVRYAEIDEHTAAQRDMADSTIGTLYIRKSALNGTIPQGLTVTVESN